MMLLWRVAAMASLLTLGACASLPTTPPDGASPLVYDPTEVEAADMIVVAAPGVLTSVSMFDPTKAWAERGVAVMRYRYPGSDGLKLDHKVTVDGAATVIAEALLAHPEKKIGLLGYSAGGQLLLSIAPHLAHRKPRTVVWSSAIGYPQTLKSALAGGLRIAGLALSTGATDMQRLWRINYPHLLVGDGRDREPACREIVHQIYAAEEPNIQVPSVRLLDAQAGDLTWRRVVIGEGPTLFLHGELDPTTPHGAVRARAEAAPAATMETLPGHGHLIHLTAPAVFDRSLAFFLDDPAPEIAWTDPCAPAAIDIATADAAASDTAPSKD